ncbi:BlaI family transcriptional regulator [Arenicella chitinivorans]|uniref:BlaI family transcriptional regulator n=2 Tax=Arenicella chitinivorans TaxID=1329800 RepID=A0A918VH18_9GAMM|nr:BlaI family transcriptional regulator [Arenicella chitinivorans]
MEVLWQESPLTSTDVVARLSSQDWNEKTVKTFLNRLVKKQAVAFTRDGRRYLYSPLISQDKVLKQESRGFLNKVFNGDMKALLATFVDDKKLSERELHYLRSLLDQQSDTSDEGEQ